MSPVQGKKNRRNWSDLKTDQELVAERSFIDGLIDNGNVRAKSKQGGNGGERDD